MEALEFFEPTRLPTKTHNELMPVRRGEGLSIHQDVGASGCGGRLGGPLARHALAEPIDGAVSAKMTLL